MVTVYEILPNIIDEQHAYDWARGMVWSEVETKEIPRMYPHTKHIGIADGVGIWYCYGADYYMFTEEAE